jgi:hypothetical protein
MIPPAFSDRPLSHMRALLTACIHFVDLCRAISKGSNDKKWLEEQRDYRCEGEHSGREACSCSEDAQLHGLVGGPWR